MSTVRGHIQVKGTQTGISGLVVQVFDASRGAGGRGSVPTRAEQGRFGLPMGSTRTLRGDFLLKLDEQPAAAGSPERKRPDITLLVLAPEEPGKSLAARLLFQSELRRGAAAEEFFSIQLDGAELASRQIALPELGERAADDPKVVALKAASELERRKAIRKELTALAKADVAEARAAEVAIEKDVRQRVLEHLTKLPPESSAWQRFVPPGGDVRAISRENQEGAIARVINHHPGHATYLALSDAEYQELLGPDGAPVADKVEARLRGSDTTPSRLRTDPIAKECRVGHAESPFDPHPPAPPAPPSPPQPPLQDVDVQRQLALLLAAVKAPESIDVREGVRPDQHSVGVAIGKLSLTKGPADVPALYDFHNLQIAFEHVWEDARAEGVIESAKQMYRATSEAGGDPARALREETGDPLRILAREAAIIRQAKGRGVLSSLARMNNESGQPEIEPDEPPAPPSPQWPRPPFDLDDLPPPASAEIVGDGFPFTVFAAGSVNFGIMVTYRQCWTPISYQAGRLAKTLTLAPKETFSFTTRQVVKTSMSRKQINSSQQMRKDDAEETQREEAEIVARAEAKTNFSSATSGGYDLGPLGEGDVTTTFGKDAASSSQDTKRSYREAIRKASRQYSAERKMEVEAAESFEQEGGTKRELSNPNDELPVTYLFYELQRRYNVTESLHRVTPVVLVGQPVPRPDQINEAWVMRNDWIVKRFLLDDSYLPALNYLCTRVQGDRLVLVEMKANLDALRATVTALKDEIMQVRVQMAARYATLEAQIEKEAKIAAENESEGFFESASEALFYNSDESKEATRIREDAARDAFERAVREEKDLRARLEREVTALQVASDTYTRALAENTNQQVQINRLVEHVRTYALHYMQGIWSYEHPDQRFLRHHTLEAPRLRQRVKQYRLHEMTEWPLGMTPQPDRKCYRVTYTMQLVDDLDAADEKATLVELVDLDKPLGFKGNYIIFPLRERNALTDFMMTPYIDAEFGLRDPDGAGNFTLEEFATYVACLREKLGSAFAQVEPELRRQYAELLADPLRQGEEIVVPTQSLYIEALVGSQPLIEDFKLLHRGLDVLKVQAEVRDMELENLRKAARILGDKLEDPNVETVKRVYYQGDTPPHDGDE